MADEQPEMDYLALALRQAEYTGLTSLVLVKQDGAWWCKRETLGCNPVARLNNNIVEAVRGALGTGFSVRVNRPDLYNDLCDAVARMERAVKEGTPK